MTFARQSLGSLAALAFGLAVSIMLPRLLGAEARGEYQLAVKLAALVLAVAQWGIPEVLLQVLAEGRDRSASLLSTSLVLGVVGAVFMAAIVWLLAPALEDGLLRGVEPLLMGLALGGSVFAIVGLLGRRFIQLSGRLDLYNGLDIARTALFLGLAIGITWLIPREAIGPTLAWVIAEVALAAVVLAILSRPRVSTSGGRGWRPDRSVAGTLIRAGAPIQLGLLAMFVGTEGGAYVLNAQLDLAAVGLYSVALAIARLVLQISVALRTALQPRLVGTEADSGAVTTRVTRHGLLWMLAAALALALGSPLVPIIFTSEFAAAGPLLVLMLPGMVAYGVWQPLAGHLLRLGMRGVLAANAWFFATTAIVLQSIGIQAFGLTGAAIGLTVAYLVAMTVVVVAFLRATSQSPAVLIPRTSDLAFYVSLTRAAAAAGRPSA